MRHVRGRPRSFSRSCQLNSPLNLTAVAEEQGKLDPRAPSYVTRRRGQLEEGGESPLQFNEDTKDPSTLG